jgi:hypothetical protein
VKLFETTVVQRIPELRLWNRFFWRHMKEHLLRVGANGAHCYNPDKLATICAVHHCKHGTKHSRLEKRHNTKR